MKKFIFSMIVMFSFNCMAVQVEINKETQQVCHNLVHQLSISLKIENLLTFESCTFAKESPGKTIYLRYTLSGKNAEKIESYLIDKYDLPELSVKKGIPYWRTSGRFYYQNEKNMTQLMSEKEIEEKMANQESTDFNWSLNVIFHSEDTNNINARSEISKVEKFYLVFWKSDLNAG